MSPCTCGSSRTVRRILAACLVSLLTLLGSVSIDLHDCVIEWRNTEAALGAISSCTGLIAMRLIQFLQDQRTFRCWDDLNSTGRRALLLHNARLFCDERQELHNQKWTCLGAPDIRHICDTFVDSIALKFEAMADADFGYILSITITEILDKVALPLEDLSIRKRQAEWVDVASLHLLMRATEDLRYMSNSIPLSSTGLQPLLYQVLIKLSCAVSTSDTLYKCWRDNKNISVYLTPHRDIDFWTPLTSNISGMEPSALADGLVSVQDCLYREGYTKLSKHSKETLSTLSLKVTLLTVSCLIYPIVLVSFKQMTEWIQNYARSLKERTEDLKKERCLAEDLLHQMLPKSVAKQLRKHKHVEAESYDQVTIFFSDVVGFTSISASCTPLQVVEMLNNLYICFDSRIESYNVYKYSFSGSHNSVSVLFPALILSKFGGSGNVAHCSQSESSYGILEGARYMRI
ncbi:uncharacterized protein LOC134965406 [Pseudophryne corroboree]|uniref:uncharacterized protein LOC134965406 n=1 Tax=Pseudophryne corroboree TaxID=495146 RepID=UPI0030819B08